MVEQGLSGLVMFLVGTTLFIGGLALAIRNARRRKGMVRVQGRVIRLERLSHGWAPVIVFTGPDGPVEFESPIANKRSWYRPGDAATVSFDPANPFNAMHDGVVQRWLAPGGLCVMGFGFGGAGFIVVLASW
jgi:hypothetical protein